MSKAFGFAPGPEALVFGMTDASSLVGKRILLSRIRCIPSTDIWIRSYRCIWIIRCSHLQHLEVDLL